MEVSVGPLERFRQRSTATLNEQQSDLQMATTYVGLGGVQVRPSYEPRLAAASAWPGVT